jgi:hypothetical protein
MGTTALAVLKHQTLLTSRDPLRPWRVSAQVRDDTVAMAVSDA